MKGSNRSGNSDALVSAAAALSAAWAHYKARHDPPGAYQSPAFKGGVGDVARAAAWAWYERRLALASRLTTGPFAPLPCRCPAPTSDWGGHGANLCQHDGDYSRVLSIDWWPSCLAWSDADCDAVDRWLAAGGEVPEVLCG